MVNKLFSELKKYIHYIISRTTISGEYHTTIPYWYEQTN